MLRWYLIQTKASSETAAQSNLERQGYEIYFPRLAQTVRRAGEWCERVGPLFPRYLFLRLREGQQALAPVRSSIGVASVVRFGCTYAVIADRIVRDLRARADPISGLHRLMRPARWAAGAAVKVAMGPFDGLEGVFERHEGTERVVVLLKLLGRDVPVRVPAAAITSGCS